MRAVSREMQNLTAIDGKAVFMRAPLAAIKQNAVDVLSQSAASRESPSSDTPRPSVKLRRQTESLPINCSTEPPGLL